MLNNANDLFDTKNKNLQTKQTNKHTINILIIIIIKIISPNLFEFLFFYVYVCVIYIIYFNLKNKRTSIVFELREIKSTSSISSILLGNCVVYLKD